MEKTVIVFDMANRPAVFRLSRSTAGQDSHEGMQNGCSMRSVILLLGSFGILGATVMSASTPQGQKTERPGRPVLEMHRDGCQKCHGAEAELMSQGWAAGKSKKDLEAILDQMVVEQAGLSALTSTERDAMLSFHLAHSTGYPWASIIESSSQQLIIESTQNSRLSCTLAGRKITPQPILVKSKDGGAQLQRWKISLPKEFELSQLRLTLAKGEGKAKKVVSWRASERPYSHSL